MRLNTARRKDPMHLYYKLLFEFFYFYIDIWGSYIDNGKPFEDKKINVYKNKFFLNNWKYVSLTGAVTF